MALWTWAHPPTGPTGSGSGALASDINGNIGIKTSTPATTLDVNGTTTIRGALDMKNNRILNVATPINSGDAVPLSYITNAITAISSSSTRVWGKGRPGATVVNSGVDGQCRKTIDGRSIRISKSSYVATWDKTAAACPANWWVCTRAERGTGACPATGAAANEMVKCRAEYNIITYADNLIFPSPAEDIVWVADTTVAPHVGMAITAINGTATGDVICTATRVWCCSY